MTNFRPLDAEFETKVRAGVSQLPFAQLLGVELLEIRPGFAEVRVPFRQELGQGSGFFQAGVIGSVADFAGGAASATLLPPQWTLVTLDFTLKIVAPGVGEYLLARGEVTRPGQSISVSSVEVFAVLKGRERLSAVALVSTRLLEPQGRREPAKAASTPTAENL